MLAYSHPPFQRRSTQPTEIPWTPKLTPIVWLRNRPYRAWGENLIENGQLNVSVWSLVVGCLTKDVISVIFNQDLRKLSKYWTFRRKKPVFSMFLTP